MYSFTVYGDADLGGTITLGQSLIVSAGAYIGMALVVLGVYLCVTAQQ